jgi:serine/threonine-protein kinase
MDPALNRPVALKLLSQHLGSEESARLRFHREAASVANLKHPHIALVYEFGEHDGQPFIALEWIEGQTLRAQLSAGRLPLEAALKIFDQLASALDYAHSHGVVHRDMKPANVMVTADGHATIVDFGLAWMASAPALTSTGLMFGTPRYMAPEQIRGEPLDARADQYSLAVMVYEMLTGQLPFEGDTTPTLLHHHLYTAPLPISEFDPTLPPEVEAALTRALAKQPAARFQSAAEFGQALRGQPVPAADTVPMPLPSPTELRTARPVPSSAEPSGTATIFTPRKTTWPSWGWAVGATALVLAALVGLGAFALNSINQISVQATQNAQVFQATGTALAQAIVPTATETFTPEPTATEEIFPTETPAPEEPFVPGSNPPRADGWWPMTAGNAERSGYVSEPFEVLNRNNEWARPVRGARTGAVVGGGLVFVGTEEQPNTTDDRFRAIDWAQSITAWDVPVGPNIIGDPAIYMSEDVAVAVLPIDRDETGELVALNIWEEGSERWRLYDDALRGRIYGGVTIGPDGNFYAASEQGWVHRITPYGDYVSFDLSELDQFYNPPAVWEGAVYVAGNSQTLYALNTENGEPVWATPADTRGSSSTAPSVVSGWGMVLVGTEDGYVHAVWAGNGKPAWPPVKARTGIVGLAHDGEKVYATAGDGSVYAWRLENGELAWAVDMATEIAVPPLVNDQHVLITLTGGRWRFLFKDSGATDDARSLDVEDGGWLSPAPAGGWLFLPGWNVIGIGP